VFLPARAGNSPLSILPQNSASDNDFCQIMAFSAFCTKIRIRFAAAVTILLNHFEAHIRNDNPLPRR